MKFKLPTDYPIGDSYGVRGKSWLWHLEGDKWVQGKDAEGFGNHRGYDFLTPIGTPIRSPIDAIVMKVGYENPENEKQGFGLRVILCSDGFRLFFGHLSHIQVVDNQKIKAGTVIGQSGNSGRTTGPHLHVELRDMTNNSLPIEWEA